LHRKGEGKILNNTTEGKVKAPCWKFWGSSVRKELHKGGGKKGGKGKRIGNRFRSLRNGKGTGQAQSTPSEDGKAAIWGGGPRLVGESLQRRKKKKKVGRLANNQGELKRRVQGKDKTATFKKVA